MRQQAAMSRLSSLDFAHSYEARMAELDASGRKGPPRPHTVGTNGRHEYLRASPRSRSSPRRARTAPAGASRR